MQAMDAIFARRSIRSYQQKPVAKESIVELLKAAFAAPTAANAQPWEYVVTDDEQQLSKLREALIFARYDAPVAIAVCGNMRLALKGPDKELWVQDCSAAIENILIAATSMGLGTVWIGVYPIEQRVRDVQRIFEMPEHVVPLSIVYVGYSAETKEPRTRYNEKRVYWHRYDSDRKHRTKDKPVVGHY